MSRTFRLCQCRGSVPIINTHMTGVSIRFLHRQTMLLLALLCFAVPALALSPARIETGFLNRELHVGSTLYRYQVYVPYGWKPSKQKTPILLALHGSGERGSEGLWQTQAGIAVAVRDHPERWPFIIVMPQCPYPNHWPDHDMLVLAMKALENASAEFDGDPERTYLTGLSLGGYGAWELLHSHPHRFAAAAIAASGIFWSYVPQRWQRENTLVPEYAAKAAFTPLWLFHGTDDTTVLPKQSELMYEGVKAAGGSVRLWEFSGMSHNCWDRAYNDPELPKWLLSHKLGEKFKPYAEKQVIPLHPPAITLSASAIDALLGEYFDNGVLKMTIYRQNESLLRRMPNGDVIQIMPESSTSFFNATGGKTRLLFDRDSNGAVRSVLYRDDRHEERWTKGK